MDITLSILNNRDMHGRKNRGMEKKSLRNHKITLSFKISNFKLANSFTDFKFFVELHIHYTFCETIKCLLVDDKLTLISVIIINSDT